MMFSSVKKAKPFESNIDIIFGEFRAFDIFERHISQIIDSTFHEKLHGLFLNLDFFLRIDASSVFFLQDPISIFFLYSRVQP